MRLVQILATSCTWTCFHIRFIFVGSIYFASFEDTSPSVSHCTCSPQRKVTLSFPSLYTFICITLALHDAVARAPAYGTKEYQRLQIHKVPLSSDESGDVKSSQVAIPKCTSRKACCFKRSTCCCLADRASLASFASALHAQWQWSRDVKGPHH